MYHNACGKISTASWLISFSVHHFRQRSWQLHALGGGSTLKGQQIGDRQAFLRHCSGDQVAAESLGHF